MGENLAVLQLKVFLAMLARRVDSFQVAKAKNRVAIVRLNPEETEAQSEEEEKRRLLYDESSNQG